SNPWTRNLFSGAWVLLNSVQQPIRATIPDNSLVLHWTGNVLTFAAAFSIFVFASSLMYVILRAGILRLSAEASGMLNRSTHQQFNELAFGNDDFGLRSIACNATPFKNSRTILLPTDLEAEITHNADDAASRSLQRLRAAIGELIAMIGSPSKGREYDKYLT